MKKETKEQLMSIFSKREEMFAEARKELREEIRAQDEFMINFRNVRDEIIRPVMEEFGALLEQHGNDYEIRDYDETQQYFDPTARLGIEIRIYPKGYHKSRFEEESTPFFGYFAAISFEGKVRTHLSNKLPGKGGSAGPGPEYELSQIDRSFVENELLSFLEEILLK
jgi:hypothetical protein